MIDVYPVHAVVIILMIKYFVVYTVEPLLSGHHWDLAKVSA